MYSLILQASMCEIPKSGCVGLCVVKDLFTRSRNRQLRSLSGSQRSLALLCDFLTKQDDNTGCTTGMIIEE